MRRILGLAGVAAGLLVAAPLAHASVISWEGAPSPSGQTYMRPVGIGVAGTTTLFVADTGRVGTADEATTPPRILKFDLGGNYLGEWATGFQASVVTDPAGNPYVINADDRSVRKYTADGSPSGPKIGACSGSGCYVTDAAVDAHGNVYIDRESQVVEYDAAGTPVDSWGPFSHDSRGITVAPSGDVYITQREPGRIIKLGANGMLTPVFDVYFPGDLAVDGSGNFYVVDGHYFEKFDSAGALLGSWQVPNANAVALDGPGRVFVTSPAGKTFLASGGPVSRLDPRDETPTVALVQNTVPDFPLATQLLTLDASSTTPPRLGTITRYEWDLDGDGSFETDGGTSPTIDHRFLEVGPQTVAVRVTGSNGLSATNSLTLNIGLPDSPLNVIPRTALTGDEVSFDARGFIIPFSDNLDYRWDLNGDGTVDVDTGTTPTLTHVFTNRLDTTVHVYVTRSGGRVDTASQSIQVLLRPPPGEPGVSINDGAFATNDRHVTLTLTWPAYAATAIASNDGGFGKGAGTAEFDVARHVPWTLRSAAADRLPRTVYLRYRATEGGTYTDDIVLDEGLPIVSSARAAHRVMRVIGSDYNTGIRTLLVKRAGAKRPLKTLHLGSASSWGRRHVSVNVRLPRGLTRAYVRAVDVAGNKSRWRRVAFR